MDFLKEVLMAESGGSDADPHLLEFRFHTEIFPGLIAQLLQKKMLGIRYAHLEKGPEEEGARTTVPPGTKQRIKRAPENHDAQGGPGTAPAQRARKAKAGTEIGMATRSGVDTPRQSVPPGQHPAHPLPIEAGHHRKEMLRGGSGLRLRRQMMLRSRRQRLPAYKATGHHSDSARGCPSSQQKVLRRAQGASTTGKG